MDRKHVPVESDEIVVNYKGINLIVSTVMREHEGEIEVGFPMYGEEPRF